jgi:predicted glycosyltransferase
MIKELQLNHDVILTSRPLANTIELIEMLGLESKIVGRHYGKNAFNKIRGYIVRVNQLYSKLKAESIDVAVSHSSFYSPAAAKLLNIQSIYLNDNEHAKGNNIAFLFSKTIMIPEFLDIQQLVNKKKNTKKFIKYPGVKEGVYLWRLFDNEMIAGQKISGQNKTIYFRPEPWSAQYYRGKQNFFDELLIKLKEKYRIVLLPRGDEQYRYYHTPKFKNIRIPEKSIHLIDIFRDCDLFIGAGGTMTREMAVLGTPTISIYQDELLAVDRYLIQEEFLVHNLEPTVEFISSYFNSKLKEPPNSILMEKGKEAYYMILETIKNFAQGDSDA